MIQDQQLMQFLVGLNDDYKTIRGSILMMKPFPSIDQVYQLIIQEEKQRSLSTTTQISNNASVFSVNNLSVQKDHAVMAIQHRNSAGFRHIGQSRTYNSNFNTARQHFDFGFQPNPKLISKPVVPDRRQYFCEHCKILGHTIQRCCKIHGYPPGYRLYKGRKMAATIHNNSADFNSAAEGASTELHRHTTSAIPGLSLEQYSQLLQLLNKHSSEIDSTNSSANIGATSFLAGTSYCMTTLFAHNTWIVDSGASKHIMYDFSLLHDVKPVGTPCYITLPDGKQVQIKHVGSLLLGSGLVLKNALHIPEFQYHLLSISKLTK